MHGGDLLTIGQLARLSGLTVKALRHYDRIGLLKPAFVDSETGYRRYERSQLPRAHAIRRLRGLDVSLDGIRRVLDGEPREATSVLEHQRVVVEAEMFRLQRIGHRLRMALIDEGRAEVISSTDDDASIKNHTPKDGTVDSAQHREMAVELFNDVWTLLERADRTPAEDDLMVHAAHASRYHWGQVGGTEQKAVGEWQCSRVYAVLGRGEPSLHHAQRAIAIAQNGDVPDWVEASAMEAVARASAVCGDESAARRWAAAAMAAAAEIEDPEDREVVMSDLATLPIQTDPADG